MYSLLILKIVPISIGILIFTHCYFYNSYSYISPYLNSQLDSNVTKYSEIYIDFIMFNTVQDADFSLGKYTELRHNMGNVSYMNTALYTRNVYNIYTYSNNENIFSLSLNIRMKHNITYNAIFIPISVFTPSIINTWIFKNIMDIDSIILNQVINTFKNMTGYLKVDSNKKMWSWLKSDFILYSQFSIINMAKKLFIAILAFAIGSIVCAIMTRIGLLSVSVVILLHSNFYPIIEKCPFIYCLDDWPSNIFYRIAPWVGIYAAHHTRTNRNKGLLILAYCLYIIIILIFYLISYLVWITALWKFWKYNTIELGEYYCYIQLLEMHFILFCRSSITILYLPKLITLANVLFIVYYQSYFYAFINDALFVLIILTILLYLLFLKYAECPKLLGNPFEFNTISMDNPRDSYILSLESTYRIGIEVWTLFYPPALRSEFNEEEKNGIDRALNESMFNLSESIRENENLGVEAPLIPDNIEEPIEMVSINNR